MTLERNMTKHFVFAENHYDLYEEVKKCSQKLAATSLLQELHKSTEPKKWLKFINALNTCGNFSYFIKETFASWYALLIKHVWFPFL